MPPHFSQSVREGHAEPLHHLGCTWAALRSRFEISFSAWGSVGSRLVLRCFTKSVSTSLPKVCVPDGLGALPEFLGGNGSAPGRAPGYAGYPGYHSPTRCIHGQAARRSRFVQLTRLQGLHTRFACPDSGIMVLSSEETDLGSGQG